MSAHILHEHEHSPLLASSVLRGQLPSWDKVKGQLRLLEIEGVDVNACGGTHLRNTAQLQVQHPWSMMCPCMHCLSHCRLARGFACPAEEHYFADALFLTC